MNPRSKKTKTKNLAVQLQPESPDNEDDNISPTSPTENRFAVPRFLAKAFEIFSTESLNEICGWNDAGDTIIIKKVADFTKEVLPKFFKHNNFQSFIRQLNMYGFHKTIIDPSRREFKHPDFRRGRADLLTVIKRKVHQHEISKKHRAQVDEVLKELCDLKNRNNEMENRLKQVERKSEMIADENRVLWQSLQSSNERQAFMQQKLERILQFMYKIFVKKSNELQYQGRAGDELSLADDFASSGTLTRNQFMDMMRVLSMNHQGSARLPRPDPSSSSTADALEAAIPSHKRKFDELAAPPPDGEIDLDNLAASDAEIDLDNLPSELDTGIYQEEEPKKPAIPPAIPQALAITEKAKSPSEDKSPEAKEIPVKDEKDTPSSPAVITADIKEDFLNLDSHKMVEDKLDDLQGELCDVFAEADFDDLISEMW